MTPEFRTGIGYDLHRLVPGRKLILGGIEIPFEKGLAGHSDADILLHAITDALLGAAALGDIGQLFPPSEQQWKDAPSHIFLTEARKQIETAGYKILNVDAVVILERPKILPYRDQIRQNLANILGLDLSQISLKGKTSEGVGPVGQGDAAEAHAIATLTRSAIAAQSL